MTPLAPVLAEHLRYLRLRDLAPTHVRKRQRAAERLDAALKGQALAATVDHLQEYVERLPRTTARSRYAEISHLACFFAWAHDHGHLPGADPCARLPRPRLTRLLPRPMAEANVDLAIAQAEPRVRVWLVLAAYQGLRACEIAVLDRSDVLDQADPPALIAHGKGRKDRVVPLCNRTLSELREYGLPRRGPLFPRLDGRPGPTGAHRVSDITNAYLHGVGIPDTLHSLRHRAATGWYAQSQDILVVGALLGHSDPASTAGYAAYSDARAVAAVRALDERHLGAVS